MLFFTCKHTFKEIFKYITELLSSFHILSLICFKLNIHSCLISKNKLQKSVAALFSSLHAVLALVVPAQIHFALEALGANVTTERFEARVFPAVGDEVGALAEGLAAHLALVGLFTCRSGHQCEKATVLSKNRPYRSSSIKKSDTCGCQ